MIRPLVGGRSYNIFCLFFSPMIIVSLIFKMVYAVGCILGNKWDKLGNIQSEVVTRKYRHKQFSIQYKTDGYNPLYKIEIF